MDHDQLGSDGNFVKELGAAVGHARRTLAFSALLALGLACASPPTFAETDSLQLQWIDVPHVFFDPHDAALLNILEPLTQSLDGARMLESQRSGGDGGGLPKVDADSRLFPQVELALAILAEQRGDLESARTRLADLESQSRAAGNEVVAAAALADQALVEAAAGRYGAAVRSMSDAHEAFVSLFRNLPPARKSPSRGADHIEQINEELTLAAIRDAVEDSGLDLAVLEVQLGNFQAAFAQFQTLLAQHPDDSGASDILSAMAVASRRAGHLEDASVYQARALRATSVRKARPPLLVAIDLPLPRDIAATISDAHGPAPERKAQAASAAADSAVAIKAAPGDAEQLRRRIAEARAAEAEGPAAAMQAWRKALWWAEQTQRPADVLAACARLQQLAAASGKWPLAIYYGKRAVNQDQQILGDVVALGGDALANAVAQAGGVYRDLTDALVRSRRPEEAALVLAMMHGHEQVAFSRDSAPALPYSKAERAMLDYDAGRLKAGAEAIGVRQGMLLQHPGQSLRTASEARQDQQNMLRASDGQLTQLNDAWRKREPATEAAVRLQIEIALTQLACLVVGPKSCEDSGLEPAVANVRDRIDALAKQVGLDPQHLSYAAAFDKLVALDPSAEGNRDKYQAGTKLVEGSCYAAQMRTQCQLSQAEALEAEFTRIEPERLTALEHQPPEFERAALGALGAGDMQVSRHGVNVVNLRYFVTDHSLWILLSAPGMHELREVPVDREHLEMLVQSFKAAVVHRAVDARPPAQRLYELLIQPVSSALARAHPHVLALAPDGPLEAIPFAALYDGSQWLVEKYALVTDDRIPADLNFYRLSHSPWQIAAFGGTQGGQGMPPIHSVELELRAVVDDAKEGLTGAVPGIRRQDKDFTFDSLSQALSDKYNVIHIASHFRLDPSDPDKSFLLLGDGTPLTLGTLKTKGFGLKGIDLLTLSACETAVDSKSTYGQVFEGFARFAQRQGAASVLASLWSVDDASTADLMAAMYRFHESRHLSKAEALAEAQRAVLRGTASGMAANASTRGATPDAPEVSGAPAKSLPSAHPSLWAAFALYGAGD